MSRPYAPPVFQTEIDLDLSRNEGRNQIGAIDLARNEFASLVSRYPDTSELRRRVAERHRVAESQVLVTAGGDDALLRCFLSRAGGKVTATTPSFEMIRRYADQVGSPLRQVVWWRGEFPIGEFLEEEAAMAVLVSPNNPTGAVIAEADLSKVAATFPFVVLDAAYSDFADEDLTSAALELGNVVVVRTLSKAFGLAGLRVGYALGDESAIASLAGYGSPYSVSGLSARLAAQSLDRAHDVSGFVAAVVESRTRLTGLLEELDCAPLPSQANFVLATDVDAAWLVAAAGSLGVGLRHFPHDTALQRCVRITVPVDDDDYTRLESTLRTVLAPEAMLFDLDGVLVDVSHSYRAAIVETAARFGVGVGPDDIAAAKGRGGASDDWELTRSLCAAAGVEIDVDEVTATFEEVYQGGQGRDGLKMRERLLVDPDVLVSWADRFPLGVVTARPARDAVEALERFGIAEVFSVLVVREDAPSKPDPAPVRLALDRLGVQRAWMVGDTVDDLVAARRAGVVPIGVVAPGDEPGALSSAARVLGSLAELEEVLDATQR